MPEGDTIHRAAAALRSALVDEKMVCFEAPRLIGITPRAGRMIESVESHGKHLEVQWDDGVILHTHMRMSGSWHLYREGESWQRPHHELRALIEVEGWRAVCFNAPLVETYRRPDASRHPGLGGLGPDLGRVDADLHRCVELVRAYDDPDATVAHVLLDQRVFCGVGNVFRCEVLWAGQLSPFARVGDLPEADATRLVNVAATLLRANLHGGSRSSVPGGQGGLAVYGRSGQRCRRCAGTIEARHAGQPARVLYWCPDCQVRFDPRRSRRDDTAWMDELPTDRHPAARKFLADPPWRRTG
jgi:endonuclease-8